MSEEKKYFALYQLWPKRAIRTYEVIHTPCPTIEVNIFIANDSGLKAAIRKAERADAKLIMLPDRRMPADQLMEFCNERIQANKFTPLFKPAEAIEEI